jgi:hypothetical protein
MQGLLQAMPGAQRTRAKKMTFFTLDGDDFQINER